MADTVTPSSPQRSRVWYVVTALVTAIVTYCIVALLMNINERKQEGRQHYLKLVELNEDTIDPAEWGKNFPRQYDCYKRTAENTSRRHGGSEAISKLDEDPRLLSVARACQTCHRYPDEEIKARTEAIQVRTKALMDRAEDALLELLDALKNAKQGSVDDRAMKEALALQRKAQWRVDFINAENSMGFHAPQESARVLAEAIDYARQGQIRILTPKGSRRQ